MGYDKMKATQLGRSSHLRFGPTLAAALLLGLTLGVAMPLGSVSAGVLASPAQAAMGSAMSSLSATTWRQELEQQ